MHHFGGPATSTQTLAAWAGRAVCRVCIQHRRMDSPPSGSSHARSAASSCSRMASGQVRNRLLLHNRMRKLHSAKNASTHKCACQAEGREQRRQQQWHQQHINKAGAASLSYRTGQHTCLGQLPRAGWSSSQSEHSCSSNRPAGSIHNAAPYLTFCLLLPRRLAQIAGQPRLPLHVHTCS